MAALAMPAVAAAQTACTPRELEIPKTTREIVLNHLVGDEIKEVGRESSDAFVGGKIIVEDCGASRYFRYTKDGKRYLIARAALDRANPCQCVTASSRNAGVPGAGACKVC